MVQLLAAVREAMLRRIGGLTGANTATRAPQLMPSQPRGKMHRKAQRIKVLHVRPMLV